MRRLLTALALSGALATPASMLAWTPAWANDFPTKPIRVLVPYGPGGATDIATRIITDRVRELLKQPIVIENKSGGSGVVALQEVVRSKPDGYTLVVGNITTNLLSPILGDPPMQFDPFKDLVPVSRLVSIPGVLITTKVNFPPNTVQEFVDYAKKHPGEINHTVAGILAYSHIDWLMLQKRAGIRLVAIPLRAGAGGGQIDIINGQVHAGLQNAATVLPVVKSGKVKAIAVTTEERLPAYPDVPTFKEAGFPGIGTNGWQALFAPNGTPKEVLDVLTKAFHEALASEKVKKQLEELQFSIIPTKSPEEAKAWLANEIVQWKPIIAEAKAVLEEQEKK